VKLAEPVTVLPLRGSMTAVAAGPPAPLMLAAAAEPAVGPAVRDDEAPLAHPQRRRRTIDARMGASDKAGVESRT
jgi:hypothetical protein